MGETLTIAIIICTKNRPNDLFITLNSIYLQEYKPDYIIVVDDSNNDETRKIIDDYSDIIYFRGSTPTSGLTAARNIGLKYVPNNTDIILFLDDDVTLDKKYLNELVKKFKNNPNIDGITGQLENGYHNLVLWKKIIHALIGFALPPLVPVSLNSYHITRTGGGVMPLFINKEPTSVEWLSGCNMAFRSSIFKNGSKFDENLIEYAMGEDALFSHKLYLEGKRFAISQKSLIKHRHSLENRMPPLKKLVMIFAYRRYLIQNFTQNKTLANLYDCWFDITFVISITILCFIGKLDWSYLNNASLAKIYILKEHDISKINKFIKGEQ